jgi:RNA recognition motif-containing protein
MLNDPVTQMFKGVAFVTLSDAGEATKACEALNGASHNGRKLRVNMAASRRQ